MNSHKSSLFDNEKPTTSKSSFGCAPLENVSNNIHPEPNPFPIIIKNPITDIHNYFVIDKRCSLVYSDNQSIFVRCPMPEWFKPEPKSKSE
jgi:hypothetical protein